MKSFVTLPVFFILWCNSFAHEFHNVETLTARYDKTSQTISIYQHNNQLILTQNAKSGTRPYIHPIIAPDGKGVLTEFSPAHHKHQTGLYWGLKKVNGRDYFMNWQQDHWRKVSVRILKRNGPIVKWQTVYNLLDVDGKAILTETQNWSMQKIGGKLLLDLEWHGEAKTDIIIEKFYVGGLFLRMPWRADIAAEVVNSEGRKNGDAEGQRASWTDVAFEIDGRKDKAHIAIFDHPANAGFPNAWRVDNEFGVGPSRQILGDWRLQKGESNMIRHRLIAYTGEFNDAAITTLWEEYTRK